MTESTTDISAGLGSFEVFFKEQFERLFRVMYLVTGDRYEAEDLAQESFARVFEKWNRVRGTDNPEGYLFRTALNLRRSRLRRATRRLSHPRWWPRARDEPDLARTAAERDALRRALANLPNGQREAVILCEWLEMTSAEAGQVLGISAGAVRVRVSRGRARLRDELAGDQGE